ncbi:MAG: hypothetical protein EKK55_06940 [Rhodocyclaceae bacterium]|nr:MAG: hypothetical protein EKK55_06940 [Rhodocyclaceae bacterium]
MNTRVFLFDGPLAERAVENHPSLTWALEHATLGRARMLQSAAGAVLAESDDGKRWRLTAAGEQRLAAAQLRTPRGVLPAATAT